MKTTRMLDKITKGSTFKRHQQMAQSKESEEIKKQNRSSDFGRREPKWVLWCFCQNLEGNHEHFGKCLIGVKASGQHKIESLIGDRAGISKGFYLQFEGEGKKNGLCRR